MTKKKAHHHQKIFESIFLCWEEKIYEEETEYDVEEDLFADLEFDKEEI
jgi:hypothetical protein